MRYFLHRINCLSFFSLIDDLSFVSQASLRMRLRISYTGPTGPVLEQTEVNNFPVPTSQ